VLNLFKISRRCLKPVVFILPPPGYSVAVLFLLQYGNKAQFRSKIDLCLFPVETGVRLVGADYRSPTRPNLISFRQCSMLRLSGPSPRPVVRGRRSCEPCLCIATAESQASGRRTRRPVKKAHGLRGKGHVAIWCNVGD
jgi:hypothetical protein